MSGRERGEWAAAAPDCRYYYLLGLVRSAVRRYLSYLGAVPSALGTPVKLGGQQSA